MTLTQPHLDEESLALEQLKTDKDEWTVQKGTRNADGSVRLINPNIQLLDEDILYHLALGSGSHDLHAMFGDVKFVCMGGTPKRMEDFAYFIKDEINYKIPSGTKLQDITRLSNRFAMYKVGPVLSVSHGMGVPSLGILLHEMIKLMSYARCKDPTFIRIGTCGGIGVEPGTVCVTEVAVDGKMSSTYDVLVLGKLLSRRAILDKSLAREISSMTDPADPFSTILGKTMCADDFYQGQGRLDGAFCNFTESQKMDYLRQINKFGVVNIEMECTIFSALTYQAGIRAAIVCVTMIDRLDGDQLTTPKGVMTEWQQRPQLIVSRFIKKRLAELELLESKIQ